MVTRKLRVYAEAPEPFVRDGVPVCDCECRHIRHGKTNSHTRSLARPHAGQARGWVMGESEHLGKRFAVYPVGDEWVAHAEHMRSDGKTREEALCALRDRLIACIGEIDELRILSRERE